MPQEEFSAARSQTALFLPHLDVLAHTGRSLLTAQALAPMGWRILFAGDGKYARLVKEAGFDVIRIPEMPASEIVSESRRGKRWPFHSAEQIRPFVIAELALIKDVDPGVVVFDHRYTAGTSAEIAGVRRVSITNLWWTPYDAIGMGLPETHPLFATAPWLLSLRRFGLARSAGARLTGIMFSAWAKPYNKVRREYGLEPLGSVLDLFSGDDVILPDTPQLTPSRDLPGNHHYVGPLVWEPTASLPDEFESLEDYVYVSMGSSADPGVFDTVVETLGMLDAPAVITTGGVRKAEEFQGLPERIRLYDFLPGSAAAAKASVVLCQGGIGTIYQALAASKPLVGIPFMPEQEVYGIGRVEELGAGVSLSARNLTPKALADAVRKVLGEPRFGEAAATLSKDIDLASGPARAAAIIAGA